MNNDDAYIRAMYDAYINQKPSIMHQGKTVVETHFDDTKKYYINGQLHREDGPAIECKNGYCEYYLFGKFYSYDEWLRLKKLIAFI